MYIAVLLAGGSGRRMGGPEPKQFLTVSGRTILEHSIRAFSQHPQIDEIIIVSHADYQDRVRQIAAPYSKVTHIVPGGKERYHSTLAAIGCVSDPNACLLIHDAVRCLVSQSVIDRCLEALQTCQAVDVAVPCTDTIIEIDANGNIHHITPRSMLRNVQTPQCFRLDVIAEAYRRGLQDPGFVTTDDAGVVHRYMPEIPIRVVEGETTNIKITYPEDLLLAEKILAQRNG